MSNCLNGVAVLLIIFGKMITMLFIYFAPDFLSQCTYHTTFSQFLYFFVILFFVQSLHEHMFDVCLCVIRGVINKINLRSGYYHPPT